MLPLPGLIPAAIPPITTRVRQRTGRQRQSSGRRGSQRDGQFSNPAAIYAEFRQPVTEPFGAMLLIQATNVLNHFQPANPTLSIDSPQTWGVITAQANSPRSMEFGLRIHF